MTGTTAPQREPVIRVGLVLPEDHQTALEITFPRPQWYTLTPPSPPQPSSHLKIAVENSTLQVNGLTVPELYIRRRQPAPPWEDNLQIRPVTAGRGFHWAQQITAAYPGDLVITVRDGALFVVNEVPAEMYLACVATAEMGPACPAALLQAQTVVARTWLLAGVEQKHQALGLTVCNDDCCQRYQGSGHLTAGARTAVWSTRGQVLTYRETLCDTRYSKCCGGMTEAFETVWDGKPVPYLQCRLDRPESTTHVELPLMDETAAERWIRSSPPAYCSPETVPTESLSRYLGKVDVPGEYYRWRVEYSQEELTALVQNKAGLAVRQVERLIPIARGGSGRLNRVRLVYLDPQGKRRQHELTSEFEIRRVLHPSFLYSSAFIVETRELRDDIPGRFILHGAGWGHGVGLCQIGALGMALQGHSLPDILAHYYPGTRLSTWYD
jgi:SpoIID/LytB domain protein